MAFKIECGNCGNKIHKISDTLSFYQTITDGGIVECKNCRARYKSKYKTSFFDGRVRLYSSIFIVLLIAFTWNNFSLLKIIFLVATFNILNFIVIFFMPLHRIDKSDELFWDIKQKV